MADQFKFDNGDKVAIKASGEHGEIIARAEYQTAETTYLIRYKAGDGRAVESWWTESSIQPLGEVLAE